MQNNYKTQEHHHYLTKAYSEGDYFLVCAKLIQGYGGT